MWNVLLLIAFATGIWYRLWLGRRKEAVTLFPGIMQKAVRPLSREDCCEICRLGARDIKRDLIHCQKCEAVWYCSGVHMKEHFREHNDDCTNVCTLRTSLDIKHKDLRADSTNDPFESAVGYFWETPRTRSYIFLKFRLGNVFLRIDTRSAVLKALAIFEDMLMLCRNDNFSVHKSIPFLLLRLGQEQRCYGFLKWWAEESWTPPKTAADLSLPYLKRGDANAFETVRSFTGQARNVHHAIALTLLKIKMLLDVRSLRMATLLLGKRLPLEVLRLINDHIVETDVFHHHDFVGEESLEIKKLKKQIFRLYMAVNRANVYYWPSLINPGDHLTAEPGGYSSGSKEEMQLALQFSYRAWSQTKGAIKIIEELYVPEIEVPRGGFELSDLWSLGRDDITKAILQRR